MTLWVGKHFKHIKVTASIKSIPLSIKQTCRQNLNVSFGNWLKTDSFSPSSPKSYKSKSRWIVCLTNVPFNAWFLLFSVRTLRASRSCPLRPDWSSTSSGTTRTSSLGSAPSVSPGKKNQIKIHSHTYFLLLKYYCYIFLLQGKGKNNS